MLNTSKGQDPIAHEERFYALRALSTPRAGKTLARWLFALCLLFLIILFFPWQQNVRGAGSVTAFSPQNRPQRIEAVIAGRIQKWHVREGQLVQAGDTIVTLTEVKEKFFDPALLTRLSEQRVAKEGTIASKKDKVNSLERQIKALREGMRIKIDQSRAKLEAERVRFRNAENQWQRNKRLHEAGNIPLTKYQEVEYKYQGAQADLYNAEVELERVRTEYMDKISKSESDMNQTKGELFESEGDLSKLKNEIVNMEIRQRQYQILAPQSGMIVKAMASGLGQTIKEGDAVCTIMPQGSDIAVEMYVKAMDVPLISRGRQVRVQFDGWPALQFSGWPSVSVGTFGGKVEVIDFVNSKPGYFRILVTPDEAWPRQLRVGGGIKGWIMLDDVPVWYEIWRQLNGFPPRLYEENLQEVLEHDAAKQKEKEKAK